MKLWQKVFCISLVCVILVTGGTTLLVLLNNFRASVRQETDRRISEHSFVVSTITNNVLYEPAPAQRADAGPYEGDVQHTESDGRSP